MSEHFPNWLKNVLIVFSVCCISSFLGWHLEIAFFIWILIPVFCLIFLTLQKKKRLNKTSAKYMRNIFVSSTALISFLFFARHNSLRDVFGEHFVQGYSVSYEPDTDDYGRSYMSENTNSAHWQGSLLISCFGWLLIILCIGIPYLTWQTTTTIINTSKE